MRMLKTVWYLRYPRSTPILAEMLSHQSTPARRSAGTSLTLDFLSRPVPQGPILFLIYVTDISRNMSRRKLFANDMKVYRVLRDTKEDVEELQILKYLRYVVKQIFVFCTFRRNAMFVSKCLGMFFGVTLFA